MHCMDHPLRRMQRGSWLSFSPISNRRPSKAIDHSHPGSVAWYCFLSLYLLVYFAFFHAEKQQGLFCKIYYRCILVVWCNVWLSEMVEKLSDVNLVCQQKLTVNVPSPHRVASARSKPDSSGRVQKTLAIVRPDALRKHKGSLLSILFGRRSISRRAWRSCALWCINLHLCNKDDLW